MVITFVLDDPDGFPVPGGLLKDGAGVRQVQNVGFAVGGLVDQAQDLPGLLGDGRQGAFQKLGIVYFQHRSDGAGDQLVLSNALSDWVFIPLVVPAVAKPSLTLVAVAAVVLLPFFIRDQEGESDPGIKFFLSAAVRVKVFMTAPQTHCTNSLGACL